MQGIPVRTVSKRRGVLGLVLVAWAVWGWLGPAQGFVAAAQEVRTVVTRLGPVQYVDVLEMEASAYYPGPESTGKWADGTTATGLIAGHGVVAVDPDVIPLGTFLYIPGYGVAIAGDVGSAIKGLKIDLCFDSYREAIMFGRRPVQVYVLAPAWVEAQARALIPADWLHGH